MGHLRVGIGLKLTLSLAVLLALPSSAGAIVYGQVDSATDPLFPNVGALIGEFQGERFVFCSGTLVAPDIFLTAAHCVGDGDTMWVSFDPTIVEPVTEAENTLYQGIAQADPRFACCGASNPFDIAVILLAEAVVGIAPAELATANLLGAMHNQALKAATFTTAGYGVVRETRKQSFQAFLPYDGTRRWASQTVNSITGAWLTLSMNQATGNGGTCYGDSGGPHFLNGVVVSLTVTGDIPCKATDRTFRVDTPWAREFLAGWGVPVP